MKVYPPGDLLKEELEERGLTQVDFAAILGRPAQTVNEILGGKKAITPEMAHLIGEALGTSPEFWMNLESQYRLWKARKDVRVDAVAHRARLFQKVPVQELVRRGYLPKTRDLIALETATCELLGISSLDDQPAWPAQLRRSKARDVSEPALNAWLALARRAAVKVRTHKFDRDKLRERAPHLVRLSESASVSDVFQELRSLGVRAVYVPHLQRTYVDGAAAWLDDAPVLVVSLRYRRIDNFWFTLMHEVGHLLLHGSGRRPFVDEHLVDSKERAAASTQEEREADRRAMDWLIPANAFEQWTQAKAQFSAAQVTAFAEELGIHPGIVVGRLHHTRKLPYTHLRGFLEPVQLGSL